MALPAINPMRVNHEDLVTRHELGRARYIKEQIAQTVNAKEDLTPDQKAALMQGVAEKLREMLLNRDFHQGIPMQIAIRGNQFNIVPPTPETKMIMKSVLGGLAAGAAATFAMANPGAASSTLAGAVSLKYVRSELVAGRDPCGMKGPLQQSERQFPKAGECVQSIC